MKITRKQLKRIIKEEKAKLLKESITDMNKYDAAFDDFSMKIADMFEADMMAMYDEDPDLIRGGRDDWQQQVVYSAQEIETSVAEAVRRAVEMIETRLHNGGFSR